MGRIKSISDLQIAIEQATQQQRMEGQLLRKDLQGTIESLNPLNLVKSTVNKLFLTPEIKGNLINATVGIISGYLAKKIVINDTHNPIKQLLGTFLQIAVTGYVTDHSSEIKTRTTDLLSKLFEKDNRNE